MVSVDPDQERGLYGKYRVEKIRRSPGPAGIEYVDPGPVFVLAYTKDPHARVALAAYAESCRTDFPELARDLRHLLEEHR